MPKSRRRPGSKKPTRRPSRSPSDLFSLDRTLERIASAGVPAPVLYHYTTWAGAEGILRTQVFWATAHDCSNDKAELKTTDPIFCEVVRKLRANRTGVIAKIFDQFLSLQEQRPIYLDDSIYLTCFSLSRDDPNQWKVYGDAGKGVCLGLRVIDEPPPQSRNWIWKLMPVEYSEEVVRKKIEADLEKFCSAVDDPHVADIRRNITLGVACLRVISAGYSISTKHSDWSREQEMRRIVIVREDPEARRRTASLIKVRSGDIRYLEVPVRNSGRIALEEVILGSQQDAGSLGRFEQLLKETGYSPGDREYAKIVMSAARDELEQC